MRSTFNCFLIICVGFFFVCCQPQTKRDRAGVGPATEIPPSPANNGKSEEPGSATEWTLNVENWEETLKTLCEQKNSSACSQLGFEAQRRGKAQEAVSYFSQACLGSADVSSCSNEKLANARSCFELSKIYESLGRSADAATFKSCSCARKFKPAC